MKKNIVLLVIAALSALGAAALLCLAFWLPTNGEERIPPVKYKDTVLQRKYTDAAAFETDQREAMISLGQAMEEDLFSKSAKKEYAEQWVDELDEYLEKASRVAQNSGMTVSALTDFVDRQYREMITGAQVMRNLYEPREKNEHELEIRWRNRLLWEALEDAKKRQLSEEDVKNGSIPYEMCIMEDREQMLAAFESYILQSPDTQALVERAFEDEVILQRVQYYQKECSDYEQHIRAKDPKAFILATVDEEIYRRRAGTAQEIEEAVYAYIYHEYEPVDWKERYGGYEYKRYNLGFNDMGAWLGCETEGAEEIYESWVDGDNHLHLADYESGEYLFFRAEEKTYVFDAGASRVVNQKLVPPDGARFVLTNPEY